MVRTGIGKLIRGTGYLLVAFVAGAVAVSQQEKEPPKLERRASSPPSEVARKIDDVIAAQWRENALEPVGNADHHRVARRVGLALIGTGPSLEEIRMIDAWPADERLSRWVDHLLADRRFRDYFAERLTRSFMPSLDVEPFFIYRRRRFLSWLSEQLHQDRPYDEIVREMVSADGIWTDEPATNFITSHELNPNRLASRTTRAFLGLRIDCAECHNHPFANWKQADFQGLADFFGQLDLSLYGVRDDKEKVSYTDGSTQKERTIAPKVPFCDELMPASGEPRQKLAHWITDSKNPYFAPATANRIWALVFGRPIIEPVDDITAEDRLPGVLDTLAKDFRTNGHDLKRMIRILTATRAFQLASAVDGEASQQQEEVYAAFPVTRLRPEQVAGSIVQTSSLRTLDRDIHWLFRLTQFANQNDFIQRYGDNPEEELAERGGNIPQRLIMMNGEVVRERLEAGLFNAAGRLARLSADDQECVKNAYLVCLTRLPAEAETAHFVETLRGTEGDERSQAVEDMMWALINSTEFSWNH